MSQRRVLVNMMMLVIGLGYVGLPLAKAFTEAGVRTVGVDKSARARTRAQEAGVEAVAPEDLTSASPTAAIFAVQTPTIASPSGAIPDMSFLLGAARTLGRVLGSGTIAVVESTVMPGFTRSAFRESLECGRSGPPLRLGYSPERISPGDAAFGLDVVPKLVGAEDQATLRTLSSLYRKVANVVEVSSIEVAEAAKLLENAQRDLCIAFANQVSADLRRTGIPTREVWAAAATKPGFARVRPGLVGGHCIGVDSDWLRAWAPNASLAGRARDVNEAEIDRVAGVIRAVANEREARRVVVVGAAYKPGVPDMRNSGAVRVAAILRAWGLVVDVWDPVALPPGAHPSPADVVAALVVHPGTEEGVRRLCAEGGIILDGSREPMRFRDREVMSLF